MIIWHVCEGPWKIQHTDKREKKVTLYQNDYSFELVLPSKIFRNVPLSLLAKSLFNNKATVKEKNQSKVCCMS